MKKQKKKKAVRHHTGKRLFTSPVKLAHNSILFKEDTNVTGVLRILDKPKAIKLQPAMEFQRHNPCPSDYGKEEEFWQRYA